MKESAFWRTIRIATPYVQWTRIENSAVAGASDVNGVWQGAEVWVELKMMRGKQLQFRQSQLGWTARRYKAGMRNIAVVARKDNKVMVWPGTVMFTKPTRVTKELVIINPAPAPFELVKPFNWGLLVDFLFNGGLQIALHSV